MEIQEEENRMKILLSSHSPSTALLESLSISLLAVHIIGVLLAALDGGE